MEEKRDRSLLRRPGRVARWVYRLPIALYRWKLGWLLGGRFLLLTHVGRTSGQLRQTVLEVVRYDRLNDTYIVAVGFGRRTDWFQNLLATPAGSVQVGRRCRPIVSCQLSTDTVCAELVQYRRRHPIAVRAIAPLLQVPLNGNESELRATAMVMPMVALRVTNSDKRQGSRSSDCDTGE